MANTVITSLNPTGFSGTFETGSAQGRFSTTGGKALTACNGTVKENDAPVGQFNAVRDEEGRMSYDFHGIIDITKLATVAAAAQASVTAIETELAQHSGS